MPEQTTFTAVAAMAENRVIGRGGKLPWHLPGDLRFFKKLTTGGIVVMGRATFESIGRPLPDRRNIVLSADPAWTPPEGVERAPCLDDLDSLLGPGAGEVFVIGGAKVYAALLPRCEVLVLTHVAGSPDGDTFFPAFEPDFVPDVAPDPASGPVLARGEGFEIRRYRRQ